jgi:hypothetical protein
MQKFHRGDLVKVNAPRSKVFDWDNHESGPIPWKWIDEPHVEHNKKCIVLGSYDDLYGGSSYTREQYSVDWCVPGYPDKGYKVAWYSPEELILVASRRMDHLDLLDKIGEY